MKPESQPPGDVFDWNDWRQQDERERRSGAARGSAALGWSYSHYRASLYLDGERFAIVTPDGRNSLSKKHAALLLEALNRKPQNDQR